MITKRKQSSMVSGIFRSVVMDEIHVSGILGFNEI